MFYFLRTLFGVAIAAAVMSSAATTSHAGAGHDHGPSEPAQMGTQSPRLIATSESYELVGILKGEKLTIYLDRMADTAPVIDANIEITIDGEPGRAQAEPDGTYTFASPALSKHGDHELILVVNEGSKTDLLVGMLKNENDQHGEEGSFGHAHADHHRGDGTAESAMPPHSATLKAVYDILTQLGMAPEAAARKLQSVPLLAGLGLAFGILVGTVVRGRNGMIVGIVGLIAILGAGAAWAGPGHDHGESSARPAAGDAPQRLPDGAVFLPKPTQRLLQIRTRIMQPETARSSTRLIGRVIADPNRSGLVQSTIGGRIKPSDTGLPLLGQSVKAGQVLAYVEPAFAPIDASDVKQTAGDLAQRIAVLDARIARQRQLVEKSVVSRASLEDLEIERTGLEARRQQLTKSRSEPEVLIAPVDGVIADVRVVAGQVISTADTLFNIVDPTSLWVEAITFDPRLEVSSAQNAVALTTQGEQFTLSFVGRSRALQQQAGILQFRINKAADELHIGSPVKVLIETGNPVTGLIVPRKAIAQAPNGQMIVFKRMEPERYLPLALRYEDLDSERVAVTGGINAGDQIIVEGAPLVNQIR